MGDWRNGEADDMHCTHRNKMTTPGHMTVLFLNIHTPYTKLFKTKSITILDFDLVAKKQDAVCNQ